jgi:uncharacterized protein (TIGR01777 family)
MKILITGATGLIGRRLSDHLSRAGHDVVAASRGEDTVVRWDPMSGPIQASALQGVEAVVHLAGENVGKGRWTRSKMERIRDSRWIGTRNLVEGIGAAPSKPRVLFCASAIGYYGDRGDELLDEESGAGGDFLAEVCKGWEEEAAKVQAQGVRRVSGRFGVVLDARDGALPRMIPPFKMWMGGPIGSGRQWMSWVHAQDVCGLVERCLVREDLRGPVNVTAPNPAPNREFAAALGRALGRPSWLKMPYLPLRLLVGKFARVLVGSQRCVPAKARSSGYAFQFPDLGAALQDIASTMLRMR